MSDIVIPNFIVRTIKFNIITPESYPAIPPRSNSIPVSKNCLTTPSGIIQPKSSPKTEPITEPTKSVKNKNPVECLFKIVCLFIIFFNLRRVYPIINEIVHNIIDDI